MSFHHRYSSIRTLTVATSISPTQACIAVVELSTYERARVLKGPHKFVLRNVVPGWPAIAALVAGFLQVGDFLLELADLYILSFVLLFLFSLVAQTFVEVMRGRESTDEG